MNDWIPVETNILPTNNKPVWTLLKGKFPCVAFYTKSHETVYEPGDDEPEFDPIEEANGECYLKPGWYEEVEVVGADYEFAWQSREVTHWRPVILPGEQVSEQLTTPYRRELTIEDINDSIASIPYGDNEARGNKFRQGFYAGRTSSPSLEQFNQQEKQIELLQSTVKELLLFTEENGHVINGFRVLEIMQRLKAIVAGEAALSSTNNPLNDKAWL